MKIREIMTTDVEIVRAEMPLREAARLMRDVDTGFLPVGEEDRLIGTLTDRDIVVRAIAEGRDPDTATVRDAMTDELVFCYEDQETSEAAQLMAERQVRRLPVVDRDKRLIGIVSQGDLATRTSDDDLVGQTVEEISEGRGRTGPA
ncbi:CBS domain-containing protein [Arenibaculum sp.]|uniref:CBS domain-containing protein n=1 Tax=Arenibaculum sp. TaxID=2865862 RepID=UPI002E130BB2|nr:CBS domain-containing protein [Arenibaculum sp.]